METRLDGNRSTFEYNNDLEGHGAFGAGAIAVAIDALFGLAVLEKTDTDFFA